MYTTVNEYPRRSKTVARSTRNPLERLYRRGTGRLAAFLARFPWITPNRISFAGFLAGGVGTPFLILTQPLWTAGILYAVADMLDYLDGDVARAQGTSSREGAIWDWALDRYTDFFAIGTLTYVTADSALPLGLAALLGAILVSGVGTKIAAEGKTAIGSIGGRA